MVPDNLRYTQQHEWIKVEGNVGTVGITDHAQHALGDMTFVELPAVGKTLKKGVEACAVESCKAAASIYAPVSGKIVGANDALEGEPGLVNSDPYGQGWIFKIELSDPSEVQGLLDAKAYTQLLGE